VAADKIMIVTGGGRGIGAATALLAAERGFKVCVNYRQDKESALSLAKRIGGIAVQADVSSEQEVLRMFDEVDR
jgi:NAD(P)-dependent dehydrogenase (short-subunit alcohol dehydrogenase family)